MKDEECEVLLAYLEPERSESGMRLQELKLLVDTMQQPGKTAAAFSM